MYCRCFVVGLTGLSCQAGGNQVERILGRTVEGRVVLDLDIVKMVRSDPKREAAMIDAGTPMVSQPASQIANQKKKKRGKKR